MHRWIRWKGAIAFALFLILCVVCFKLFASSMIKNALEYTGTKIIGAKVEVESVNLSLNPLRLILKDLRITNPEKPMTNAIQCAKMDFAVEPLPLLKKKIIIDHMITTALEFGTPRKYSGAIARENKQKKEAESSTLDILLEKTGCGKMKLPKLDIPDIMAILEKEDLESIKQIQLFQRDIKTEETSWQNRLKALPDEKTFGEYQKKMNELQNKKKEVTSLLSAADDILKIKKDIDRDIDTIKNAKTNLQTSLDSYQLRIKTLSMSPVEDIRKLKAKYSLTPEGISNFSNLIFGEQFCFAIKKYFLWYERFKPYIEKIPKSSGKEEKKEITLKKPLRAKGFNVRFKERHPLPDLLIRKTSLNVIIPAGDLTGIILNLTDNQALAGNPTTISLLGNKMKGIASAQIDGSFNFIDASAPKHALKASIRRFAFSEFSLLKDNAFPLVIEKALADIAFDSDIIGKAFTVSLKSKFDEVKLDLGRSFNGNSNEIISALVSSLQSIRSFDLSADLERNINDLDFNIHSDIDSILKKSIGQLVQKEMVKFEQQLKANIMSKIKDPLKNAEESLSVFGPFGDEISNRLKIGEDLLKNDLFKKAKIPLINK